MKDKTYFLVTGIVFLVVALLHAARLFFGWEAMIGGWEFPRSISVVGLFLAGYLTYAGIRLYRR